MSWISVFTRIPALAVATPIAIVFAIWIAAMYGYKLEIDVIGLRFDKPIQAIVTTPVAEGVVRR
ncbi:hypothetical protein G6M12_24675 [Agrobacterium tumefaciens]|nr:hypothetical protein ASD74_20690 [Rhizobium sp. Root564]NTE84751.1 hypothetical protein [Agrobacterium tumefaciens]